MPQAWAWFSGGIAGLPLAWVDGSARIRRPARGLMAATGRSLQRLQGNAWTAEAPRRRRSPGPDGIVIENGQEPGFRRVLLPLAYVILVPLRFGPKRPKHPVDRCGRRSALRASATQSERSGPIEI